MDTSRTYIKMCDCPEIQGLYKKEENNFLRYHSCPNRICHHKPVWLPRQDQLQERIDSDWTGELLRRFYNWCKDYGFTTKVNKSMEQLWLAFVMKENHNKKWDGEKWIKEE